MLPDRKAEIWTLSRSDGRVTIESEFAKSLLRELLSEVDRLEGEIAQRRNNTPECPITRKISQLLKTTVGWNEMHFSLNKHGGWEHDVITGLFWKIDYANTPCPSASSSDSA